MVRRQSYFRTRNKQQKFLTETCLQDYQNLNVSPRALNKKRSQVNANQFMVEEQTNSHTVSVKDDRLGNFAHPKGSISSCQYDKKMALHVKDGSGSQGKEPDIACLGAEVEDLILEDENPEGHSSNFEKLVF